MALLVVAVVGCGDDDAPPDADVDTGVVIDAGPPLPTEPEPPTLPTLTPCAEGWRDVVLDDGVTVCDPRPEGGVVTCDGVDEAHFPGEPGCTRVGTACPVGDLPEGLPTDVPIMYVLASAPDGGDGSLAMPYNRLGSTQIDRASTGGIIAIGKGTYDVGELAIYRDITLWGACTAETILTSTVRHDFNGMVDLWTGNATIKNLRVSDPLRIALSVYEPKTLRVEDVVIEGAHGAGLLAANGLLEMQNVVVRGTVPRSDGSSFGMRADPEAMVTVRRAVFEGNTDQGIMASGATVDLEQVVVRDIVSAAGVTVSVAGAFDATLTGRQVVVEGARDIGVFCSDGASCTFEDSFVGNAETTLASAGTGRGATSARDGHLTLRRTYLHGNNDVAMTTFNPGSTLLAEDVVVDDTGPDSTGWFGIAVSAEGDGQFTVRRALFVGNRDAAVNVDGFGGKSAFGELEDVTIRGTQPRENGNAGVGIRAWTVGRLVATRVVVEDHFESGIMVTTPGSSAVLNDVVVRGVRPNSRDGTMGFGIEVSGGAQLEVNRVRVIEASATGLIADGLGSELTGEDIEVIGTQPSGTGRGGHGVSGQNGAQLAMGRLRVGDVYEFGLVAVGGGTVARVSGLTIAGVNLSMCAETGCPGDYVFGSGVIGADAIVDLSDFLIEGCAVCGVRVDRAGQVDLVDGAVQGNPIGACVQVDGYDLDRLNAGVSYRDNETNLNATSLPVPEEMPVGHE